MAPRIINKYRLFCNTENNYVYDWCESIPTVCPNNNVHIIDNSSISITDTIDSNTVNVIQASGDVGDNYRVECKCITAPANQTVSFLYSWPFNISIMNINWTSTEIHRGDIINGYVAPNTTIGVVTQQINNGDTIIHVSNSVFDYINNGFYINITNGSQIIDLGQCICINKSNNTIKCENSANNTMKAGAYLQMTIRNIKDLLFVEPESITIANKHIKSSFIPANINLKFDYQNNSGVEKKFKFIYEYIY